MKRTAWVILGWLSLGTACASAGPTYASFDDVEYGYANERTVWSQRAGLSVRIAELTPSATSTAGAKTPIVLLHPWGFNMSIWSDIAPGLAETRRVVLVDLPGHGKSDKSHTALPMARLAAAVVDAMDAAGLSTADVAGNSLGGATAVAVAEAAPDRVRRLVLIGAPGGAPLPVPLHRLVRGMATPREVASLSDDAWWVGLTIAERSDRPLARRLRADAVALRSAAEFPAWCRASIEVLRSVMAYAPKLERIQAPALVVYGGSDWVITDDSTTAMAERLPKGKRTVLDGCGHMPEIDCPDRLLALLVEFIDQQGSGGLELPPPSTTRSGGS